MSDLESEDEFQLVSVIDENGIEKVFQVIDDILLDGIQYLVSIPKDNSSFSEEKVVFIEKNDAGLFIIKDEKIKQKINDYLTTLTLNGDIEFITVLANDGGKYEYEVIDTIELKGNKYLIAIDQDSKDEDDFTVFKMHDETISVVEDEETINEIIEYMENYEDDEYDETQITLKQSDGKVKDFNIIGKLEIYGNNYLIATPEEMPEKEFIALLLENSKIVSYFKDHLISNDVRFYLDKVHKYILENKNKGYYFEDN